MPITILANNNKQLFIYEHNEKIKGLQLISRIHRTETSESKLRPQANIYTEREQIEKEEKIQSTQQQQKLLVLIKEDFNLHVVYIIASHCSFPLLYRIDRLQHKICNCCKRDRAGCNSKWNHKQTQLLPTIAYHAFQVNNVPYTLLWCSFSMFMLWVLLLKLIWRWDGVFFQCFFFLTYFNYEAKSFDGRVEVL